MISCFILLLTCWIPGTNDVVVVLDSGERKTCSLKSITNTELLIDQPPGKIALSQIQKVILRKPVGSKPLPSGINVFAAGDTQLKASRLTLDGDEFDISLATGQPGIRIKRQALDSIRFAEDIDSEKWNAVISKAQKADGLIIQREDRLDLISGLIKNLDQTHVDFETRGRSAKVALNKIAALKFFQPQSSTEKINFRIVDIYDNRYGGVSIRSTDQHVLIGTGKDATTRDTANIQIPIQLVAEIDFSAGKFVELPSLNPQSNSWEPFAKARVTDSDMRELLKLTDDKKLVWTRNQSFNEPLMIDIPSRKTTTNPVGRITYQRGLAIQGGTSLVYVIPEDAETFMTDAGIQASRNKKGSVQLEILVDSKSVFRKRITATDRDLTQIQIPVSGDRITFSVGYGGDNESGDVLVLGNPKFKTVQ